VCRFKNRVLRATQRRDFGLRVGCIRWQHAGLPIPGESREIIAEDVVSRNPTMSAAATTVIAAPAHSR
jgi:hypothetical protein